MKVICVTTLSLLLVVELTAGTRWSNCFNEQEVYNIFDECVSRSTRDLSRISYKAAEEDEGFAESSPFIGERASRQLRSPFNRKTSFGWRPKPNFRSAAISERNFFSGLFPVDRPLKRRSCRMEFLSGTTVFAEVNPDVIKDNMARVAKPGKLDDIKAAVDDCQKTFYSTTWFKVTYYQKCFMMKLEYICSFSSPDPADHPGNPAPTTTPGANSFASPVTKSVINPVTGGQSPLVTDYVKCGPEEYTLDCF